MSPFRLIFVLLLVNPCIQWLLSLLLQASTFVDEFESVYINERDLIDKNNYSTRTETSQLFPQLNDIILDEVVTVVGGGLSGLLATLEVLHSRPQAVVVLLEAAGYFGGRVYNAPVYPYKEEDVHRNESSNLGRSANRPLVSAVEVGATFIHGIYDNPMMKLAKVYGLETTPVNYDNFMLFTAEEGPLYRLSSKKTPASGDGRNMVENDWGNVTSDVSGTLVYNNTFVELVKNKIYDPAREVFFALREALRDMQVSEDGYIHTVTESEDTTLSVLEQRQAYIRDLLLSKRTIMGLTSVIHHTLDDFPLSELFTEAVREVLMKSVKDPRNGELVPLIQDMLKIARNPLNSTYFNDMRLIPPSLRRQNKISAEHLERVLSWWFFWEIVQDQIATLPQLSSLSYDGSLGLRGPDHIFDSPKGIQALLDAILHDIVEGVGLVYSQEEKSHFSSGMCDDGVAEDWPKRSTKRRMDSSHIGGKWFDDCSWRRSSYPSKVPAPVDFNISRYLTDCSAVPTVLREMLRGVSKHRTRRVILALECPAVVIKDNADFLIQGTHRKNKMERQMKNFLGGGSSCNAPPRHTWDSCDRLPCNNNANGTVRENIESEVSDLNNTKRERMRCVHIPYFGLRFLIVLIRTTAIPLQIVDSLSGILFEEIIFPTMQWIWYNIVLFMVELSLFWIYQLVSIEGHGHLAEEVPKVDHDMRATDLMPLAEKEFHRGSIQHYDDVMDFLTSLDQKESHEFMLRSRDVTNVMSARAHEASEYTMPDSFKVNRHVEEIEEDYRLLLEEALIASNTLSTGSETRGLKQRRNSRESDVQMLLDFWPCSTAATNGCNKIPLDINSNSRDVIIKRLFRDFQGKKRRERYATSPRDQQSGTMRRIKGSLEVHKWKWQPIFENRGEANVANHPLLFVYYAMNYVTYSIFTLFSNPLTALSDCYYEVRIFFFSNWVDNNARVSCSVGHQLMKRFYKWMYRVRGLLLAMWKEVTSIPSMLSASYDAMEHCIHILPSGSIVERSVLGVHVSMISTVGPSGSPKRTSIGIDSDVVIVGTPLGVLQSKPSHPFSQHKDDGDDDTCNTKLSHNNSNISNSAGTSFRGLSFSPPLPMWKRDAISHTGCSETFKIAIRFDRVFWPEDVEFFGIVGGVNRNGSASGRTYFEEMSDWSNDTHGDGATGRSAVGSTRDTTFLFGDGDHIEIMNLHKFRKNKVLVIEVENRLARDWSELTTPAVAMSLGKEYNDHNTHPDYTSEADNLPMRNQSHHYNNKLLDVFIRDELMPRLMRAFPQTRLSSRGPSATTLRDPVPTWYRINNYVYNPYIRCGFSYWKPSRSSQDNMAMQKGIWRSYSVLSSPLTAVMFTSEDGVKPSLRRELYDTNDKFNPLFSYSHQSIDLYSYIGLTKWLSYFSHISRNRREGSKYTRSSSSSFTSVPFSTNRNRLLFTGEHTTPHFYGNMHGAVVEGQRAAIEAAQTLIGNEEDQRIRRTVMNIRRWFVFGGGSAPEPSVCTRQYRPYLSLGKLLLSFVDYLAFIYFFGF